MSDARGTPGISRRGLLALGGGVFVVAAIPLGRRAFGSRAAPLVRRTLPIMGTFAEFAVVVRGAVADRGAAERAIDSAVDRLRFVDATMSFFRADSDVGRVNAEAGAGAVAVHPETAVVLAEARRWAERSGGAFDPCLGRACAAWDVVERREPPPAAAYAPLAGRGLWTALELGGTARAPTARLAVPDAALDLGGIAKGHAVDLAVAALRNHGVEHAIVNVGGDLYAMGRSADGDAWRVGVRDPDDPARISRKLALSDEAVATSGDYVRRFEHEGRAYHHLLDPRTAAPHHTDRHSVTVRAATCLEADAEATTRFVASASPSAS